MMSAMLGGRSGNRGECAQPCRMSYNGSYPLSIKDMCLASHVPELMAAGVASLKIEGRMKSPAYVYGVSRIYRRLLDVCPPHIKKGGALLMEIGYDQREALTALCRAHGFSFEFYRDFGGNDRVCAVFL